MKRIAIACAAVLGMIIVGSTSANAADVHVQIGGFRSPGFYGGFGYGGQKPFRKRSPVIWHDTSHYHYHPGVVVPHGNHYHYIPGHWDLHRTGHYDTIHRGHIYHHGY